MYRLDHRQDDSEQASERLISALPCLACLFFASSACPFSDNFHASPLFPSFPVRCDLYYLAQPRYIGAFGPGLEVWVNFTLHFLGYGNAGYRGRGFLFLGGWCGVSGELVV